MTQNQPQQNQSKSVGTKTALGIGILGLLFGFAVDEAIRNYAGADNIFSQAQTEQTTPVAQEPVEAKIDYGKINYDLLATNIMNKMNLPDCYFDSTNINITGSGMTINLYPTDDSLNYVIDSLGTVIDSMNRYISTITPMVDTANCDSVVNALTGEVEALNKKVGSWQWSYKKIKEDLTGKLADARDSIRDANKINNFYQIRIENLEGDISAYDSTIKVNNLGKYFSEPEPIDMGNDFWSRDKNCIIKQDGGDQQ